MRDLPRLLPRQAVEIDQNAHQLRHGDGGMGVVELHRDVIAKRAHVLEHLDVPAHQIEQRGGGEEILLPEPQLLPAGVASEG